MMPTVPHYSFVPSFFVLWYTWMRKNGDNAKQRTENGVGLVTRLYHTCRLSRIINNISANEATLTNHFVSRDCYLETEVLLHLSVMDDC